MTKYCQIIFLFYAMAAALFLGLPGCGGGGGGGGGNSLSSSNATSATFGDLSGETDPDGDGTILVQYFLYSNKAMTCDIAMDFSVDGGETFSSCTEDQSPLLGGEKNPTEGLENLAASRGGVEHIFSWNSDAAGDLPDQNLNCVRLRITIQGKDSTLSSYFTVLNDRSDADPPEVADFTATAVKNASNDILAVTFDEAVEETDAEKAANYHLEDPTGEEMDIPAGSSIGYDVVARTTTIVLDGAGRANLRYGTQARIAVSGVHDLVGNEIVAGSGGTAEAAVGGDGANIPADQPDLVLAVFYGSGNPAAGDSLVLLFDEDVDVDAAGTIDPGDVVFWHTGDTIGSGSPLAVSTVESEPKALRIVLGQSPPFTAGTSLINVSNDNDVMEDLAGNKAYFPSAPTRDDYVTVIANEYQPPVIDLLTVDRIPYILNGTGTAGGTIKVPRSGFTIDLAYHDEGGAGVDPDTISIVCSLPATADGVSLPAGTDLVPFLTADSGDGDGASFSVPSTLVFNEGQATFRATVADLLGNESAEASYSCMIETPTNSRRPFRTTANASQVWNLLFGRDLYTISISGNATISVTAARKANGTADFNEDLELFGLGCEYPITIPGLSQNSNEFLRSLVIDGIESQLSDVIYAGANITFKHSNSASFPGNAPQVAYNSYKESIIAIGGDSDLGALGCAFIDRLNANQDNDKLYKGSSPYNPGTNLGIFTTRIFIYEVNGSYYGLFRLTFDDFIPGRGVPVGTDIDDQAILMDIAGTGPSVTGDAAVRRDAILTAIQRLSRYIAVVTSHEMGHSMGLAVNGKMPNGLYGGDNLNFPGSTDNHICLSAFPDLFVSPNVNIMTPATNFTYTNGSGTRFNRLNEAYFKEEAFYNK